MTAKLLAEKESQRKFLEQLMDGSKLEGYSVSIPVDAELRKYQQVCLQEYLFQSLSAFANCI